MKSLLLLSALLPLLQEPEAAGDPNKNALQFETSPYLLQHAGNPVDWMPWGEEAFAKAKAEDKPIFLSSGYSACHWCHVMEHESFEDERIAALINEFFVPVKLDREERPDVDAIYMAVVQRMTGSGGWPLSVWMTPDLEPFYGGTYFPPKAMSGRYSFEDVIRGVHKMWTETRDQAVASGKGFVEGLNGQQAPKAAVDASIDEIMAKFDELATGRYDPEWAGFAQQPNYAPKFPRAVETSLLLRRGRRTEQPKLEEMALETLDSMVEGGMYDQIGGGFARYSVDRAWLVPHFEKMLYDNAQLVETYLEGWQATRNSKYERIVRETLDYLIKEMRSPEGGFYSATDADSADPNGHMVEGYYFVWTEEEFEAVTGEDAAIAKVWFGVKKEGNFHEVPGGNVLTARREVASVAKELGVSGIDVRQAVASAKRKLYEARAKRTPPRLDDKVLSAWNGLALTAFSRAAAILEDARYLEIARQNADFLLTKMVTEEGGLYRTRRLGVSTLGGFLQDHAFVVQGLIDLFEADQDPETKARWLKAAMDLHSHTEAEFAAEDGGYWTVAKSRRDKLPIQLRTAQEGSLPSDVATAATNAYRLGLLAGDPALVKRTEDVLARHDADISNYPNAHGKAAQLLELLVSDPREIYIVGPRNHPHVEEYLKSLQKEWPPHTVFAHATGEKDPLAELLPPLEAKTMRDGEPTIYICRGGVCDLPHTLAEILGPLPASKQPKDE